MEFFLNDLNRDLHLLIDKDNIENPYHNFITSLSNTISKFSTKVSYKKNNRTTNRWNDNDCKIDRKVIRDDSNETLKLDNINMYKSLIKIKKIIYK